MESLTNICLECVADYADRYSKDTLYNLPVPALRDLVYYLSAFQLNRHHDIFEKAEINTHAIWSAHLTHRWTKSYQKAATLFRDHPEGVRTPDPRQVYFERHFQWLLGHIATDAPRDLMRDVHVPLPKLRRQGPYVTMKYRTSSSCVIDDDLHLYAPFVRVLSIMATTLPMIDLILDDAQLLSILQGCVLRLDLYFVSERNFERSKELVTKLVQYGSVREFALFSAQLPLQQLTDLLSIAATQSPLVKLNIKNTEMLSSLQKVAAIDSDAAKAEMSTEDMRNSKASKSHLVNIIPESHSDAGLFDESSLARESSNTTRTSPASSSDDIYSCWHQNEIGGRTWSNSKDNIEEVDDLFNVAVLSSRRPSPHNQYVLAEDDSCHGCVSLTIAYLKADYVVQEALSHVLPLWSSLKKLAILEVNVTDGEIFEKFLTERIECGGLSHLILYESDLCRNILDVIIMSLLNRTGSEPMREISVTFSDSHVRGLSDEVFTELQQHFFFGTVNLDLSNTCLSPDKVLFIPAWVSHDLALRHLYLRHFQNLEIVPDIMSAALETGKLETLCFEGIPFSLDMEARLLLLLQRLNSLRSLNLNDCGLSSELVSSDTFIDVIAQRTSLTELCLAQNRLENAGCKILKIICMKNPSRSKFHFLDLSYNRIDGTALIQTADEIYDEFVKSRYRDNHIFKLRLGGNLFGRNHTKIVQQYLQFVDIVIAMVTVDFMEENPLVDHLAQM